MLRGLGLRLCASMKCLLTAIADVLGTWAKKWAKKWVKRAAVRRQFAADSDAFARLDASALRDLGMSRSEFNSYWAESHGLAERTRMRVDP